MPQKLANRVAENAPAMLVYLDSDLRVRFANRHCYELLGRAPREILGRLLAELLDERTLRYALSHVAEVDRGNPAPRDYVLLDREGARKFLQIRAVADRDAQGRRIGYFACSADNAAQRAAEARLRHALAGAGAGIWEWNLDEGEVYYSPEFSALLGYEEPRFAAEFNFFSALHPDDHAGMFDAFADAVQEGRRLDREFRMLCTDGGYRWLRGVGRAECDADSGSMRFVGTARDISARKHAELELAEARKLVVATLEGCMEVCEELNERRRLDRVKRELFTAANHELRTPLASIIAALELLREGADAVPNHSRESFLELALQNAEQLARVVEQWLDLERIDLGVAGIRCEPLELEQLVAAQVRAKAPLAAERGVSVAIVERHEAQVSADRERLAQAIEHLLAKAIERSPRGATVRVHVGVRAERAVLLIEDEGPDALSDADLGLTACKAIVERQGGSLEAANRAARGAAFHLELPCR